MLVILATLGSRNITPELVLARGSPGSKVDVGIPFRLHVTARRSSRPLSFLLLCPRPGTSPSLCCHLPSCALQIDYPDGGRFRLRLTLRLAGVLLPFVSIRHLSTFARRYPRRPPHGNRYRETGRIRSCHGAVDAAM